MKPWFQIPFVAVIGSSAACSILGPVSESMGLERSSLVLITPAPNASPTSTPFQPPIVEQAESTSLYFIEVPTLEPFLPIGTPSASEIVPQEPISTLDLNSLFPRAAAPPIPETSGEGPQPYPQLTSDQAVTFLLLGSDKRSGGSYRTDTMIIVILWPKEAQVSMISIPRDLWVYIPDVGMQRINTAYQIGEEDQYAGGGPGLLRDTISYNLGIRIDHTAKVEFDGFRRIMDTLGGVDVPVTCSYTDWKIIDPTYDPEIEANWSLHTIQPGIVHMDGDLALWYARSRLKSNDFDRGRRQQEVLRAALTQALRTETLSRIRQLYTGLSAAISTDLKLGDILKLALYAPRLSGASIRSYFIRPPLVTEWVTPAGANVLLPDQSALELKLRQATTLSSTEIRKQAISVEILNGTPLDGMDVLAEVRLNYAGYATRMTPADRRDYDTSILIDTSADQDPDARAALLKTIGLSTATQISAPDPAASTTYQLVLGNDYQPCFAPQELAQ